MLRAVTSHQSPRGLDDWHLACASYGSECLPMVVDSDDKLVAAIDGAGDETDIAAEVALLFDLLDQSAGAFGRSDLGAFDILEESLAADAPRERYKLAGPTVTRVAAVGIASLPAVLAPVPAFAGTPMSPNMMLAMASRPAVTPDREVPPALAATGPQLFPFSRPMLTTRSQAIVPVAEPSALTSDNQNFSLNPRLRSIFSEQRKVAVTTKRQASGTMYRVQAGDSLYSIAQNVLGSGSRWREIYQANQDKVGAGYLLRPGQRLVIKTTPPAATASSGGKGYRVSSGDNLYTIAQTKLGDANRWREIVALNKALLKGKTTIFPNQWLILPQQQV